MRIEQSLPYLERSIPTSQAEHKISPIADALDSSLRIHIREPQGLGRSVFEAICSNGEQITYGCGKGSDSRIGAFGECLEHLHIWLSAQHGSGMNLPVPVEEIYTSDAFMGVGSRFMSANESVLATPFVRFGSRSTEHIFVPSALVNVFLQIDERPVSQSDVFFRRYASSSGTAFGFSFQDAMLHASLEIIERDEISKLFISLVGLEDEQLSYELISNYSFNAEVEEAVERLRQKLRGVGLITCLRKTSYGAYFSFSKMTFQHEGQEYVVWGAGCSLYRDLAIYRSVTECEQMADGDLGAFSERLRLFTQKYSRLRCIYDLNLSKLQLTPVTLEKELSVKKTTDSQLELLSQSINSSGREILFCAYEPIVPSYSVVTAYITDTEKFFNVKHGLPALPISHLRKYDPRYCADRSTLCEI
ncbi:YcaO-like family protein [Acinetobacter pittii]|uniref:YcaO-like family protein n=1 Tax=Acinetobacter pittii TaxID=48296 RepID=UPI0021CDD31A|nr:YcaO-like family protein [Acinetobacter pittii]MCU4548973.1 YcaO-like family protein [Acinetobacter pittii]